jgi:hypothetical protein
LLDENLFGQIRVTEEIERLGAEPEAQRIAVLALPRRHHVQRALLEERQMAQQRDAAGNIVEGEGLNRLLHGGMDRLTLFHEHCK